MDQAAADKLQREVLLSFLEEADEALREVDTRLVALESEPQDTENLGAIFRAIHTVKGNSTFFGLMKVKQLAHQMEDLLDLLREGKLNCLPPHVDCLLSGVDELKRILDRVRSEQEEVPAEQAEVFAALLRSIQDAMSQKEPAGRTSPGSGAAAGDPEAARRKWREALATLRAIRSSPWLPKDLHQPLDALRAALSELAPASVDPEPEPLRIGVVDGGEAAASASERGPRAPGPPPAEKTATEQASARPEDKSAPAASPPPPSAGGENPHSVAASAPARGSSAGGKAQARTMRVEEARIEEFLDYVGELIITREMLGNVGNRLRLMPQLNKLSVEYQRAMEAFTALSHDLQTSIMEIRKVPIKLMLTKAPRLVRDVATARNKEARVVLEGESTQVDKSLLEALEDPFVHMMRNAVDHGLESPDVRESRGKPRQGTIVVRVTETADELLCRIQDDGGGLDTEKLKQKALEDQLISPHAASSMTEQEAYQLIFSAGLSTAEKVTEVSGRGVGMDVVRRNITELGGRIEIESRLGEGTAFTIHLPKAVSVQIFDGFLVRVESERLVLPLRSVSESFRPTPDQVHTIVERGECVRRRGRVFPLVRCGEVLSLSRERRSVSEGIVVSIEVSSGRPAGLLVDEVLGVQQVVLREVEGLEVASGVYSGGAVLGDGRVAMVVDVERLGALMS